MKRSDRIKQTIVYIVKSTLDYSFFTLDYSLLWNLNESRHRHLCHVMNNVFFLTKGAMVSFLIKIFKYIIGYPKIIEMN